MDMKWLAKFEIDHRWIFLALFVILALPLLMPIGLPINPSPETRQAFDFIEKLPNGSKVLLGFDYEAQAVAECEPMATAVLNHLIKKDIKVVGITSSPQGTLLGQQMLEKTYAAAGKKYGTDYVDLGFFGGGETGLAAVAGNIRGTFQKDSRGTPLDQLPLMQGTNKVEDFALSISINVGPLNGASTDGWVRQVSSAHKMPVIMAVVAVMGPAAYPYLRAGQMQGLLVGLRGAADYEVLMDTVGAGRKAMDALSLGHMLVILLIILGNIALWAKWQVRRQARAAGGGVAS